MRWIQSVEMILKLLSARFQKARCPCRCVLAPTASPYVFEIAVNYPHICEPNIEPGYRQRIIDIETAMLENDILAFRPTKGKVLVCYPVGEKTIRHSEQVVINDKHTAVFVSTFENDNEIARDVVAEGFELIYWVDQSIDSGDKDEVDIKHMEKRNKQTSPSDIPKQRKALYIGSGYDRRFVSELRDDIKRFVFIDSKPYPTGRSKSNIKLTSAALEAFQEQLEDFLLRFGFDLAYVDRTPTYDKFKFVGKDRAVIEIYSGIDFPHIPKSLAKELESVTDLIVAGHDPHFAVLDFIGHPVHVIAHSNTTYFAPHDPLSAIQHFHIDPSLASSVTMFYPRWNISDKDYREQPGHRHRKVKFKTIDDAHWFSYSLRNSDMYNQWLQMSLEDEE